MSIFQLALRNTRRETKRSILTGIAIGLGVATIIFTDAYIRGAFDSFLESFIRLDAGHVKIMPKNAVERTKPLPLDEGIKNLSEVIKTVEAIPSVLHIAPRLRFGVLLDKPGGSIPALGIAMMPSRETEFMDLQEYIIEGQLPSDNENKLLIGKKLAKELNLKVGDELFMVAKDAYGGFGPGLYTVAGITSTGVPSIDRRTFYLPLPAAQDQLAIENSALEIVCRVEGSMYASEEVALIIQSKLIEAGYDDLEAVPWQKQGMIYSMIEPARYANGIIIMLLAVIAISTVINTVLMSVMERTRELGTMRALGYGRRQIVWLIISESFVIGIISSIFGIILGMGMALWIQRVGIDFSAAMGSIDIPMKPIIYPEPRNITALWAAVYGVVISALAAWYPARVAVRMHPAEAIRAE
ncbi:MAG: FtsX-like permease family protein [Candidatus Electryonea clarkiae]|nr:FtsX-like permease family protein [Candidatus Electryonea clarkiae]MDP8288105.1 FtsX-like permease family protein [Candidatus Electryonea clarkiae]